MFPNSYLFFLNKPHQQLKYEHLLRSLLNVTIYKAAVSNVMNEKSTSASVSNISLYIFIVII